MDRRRFIALFSGSAAVLGVAGCGGAAKDAPKQVQVTDELKRQAEASDAYFTEQSKQKKGAAK